MKEDVKTMTPQSSLRPLYGCKEDALTHQGSTSCFGSGCTLYLGLYRTGTGRA